MEPLGCHAILDARNYTLIRGRDAFRNPIPEAVDAPDRSSPSAFRGCSRRSRRFANNLKPLMMFFQVYAGEKGFSVGRQILLAGPDGVF
jgi:hypothetical protein